MDAVVGVYSFLSSIDNFIIGLLYAGPQQGFNVNPLDIATNAESGGKITMESGDGNGFAELFQLPALYQLLKKQGMLIAAILILWLLVTMFFVRRSDHLAEKKADILHKLFIVFLMASTLFILSSIINLFDTVF